MAAWSVRLRDLATSDIEAATDYYGVHGGHDVALRFVDAVEGAIDDLAMHPRTGTTRFAYELDIPELLALPVPGFPYLLFYVARDERIDVWRALHTRRDLGGTLRGDRDDRS